MFMDTEGERDGGTNWESSTDTYSLPCVKQIASGKVLCSKRSSAWCSAMIKRNVMGGGVGGPRWRGYS